MHLMVATEAGQASCCSVKHRYSRNIARTDAQGRSMLTVFQNTATRIILSNAAMIVFI